MSILRGVGVPLLSWVLIGCGPRPFVSDDYKTEPTAPSAKPGVAEANFPYREYIDAVYNAHNPDAVDKYFSPSVVVHSLAPEVEGGNGTAYLKELAKNLIAAFPDLHVSVDEVVQQNDRVAARVILEGTHKGEFAGIPATGRKIKVANFAMYRVEAGKIAEVWSLTDLAQLRIQLTEKK
jgi:steroid delta-isomerase-like uncharacterized protein